MAQLIASQVWIGKKLVAFLFQVSVIVHFAGIVEAQSKPNDSEIARRFRIEAPIRWKEYRELSVDLQGTSVGGTAKNGQSDNLPGRAIIKRRPGCALYIAERPQKNGDTKYNATGFNSEYSFSVFRNSEKERWGLTSLQSRSNQVVPVGDEWEGVDALINRLITAFSEDLITLTSRPTFRIKNAASIEMGNEKLVEIAFDNSHPISVAGEPFCAIQAGTLVLDPTRYWCVRSYKLRLNHTNGEAEASIENQIHDLPNGFPSPKHSVAVYTARPRDQSAYELRTIGEYSFDFPKVIPSYSEFKLSAFGIHEPENLKNRSSTWWYWGICGISVAIGLILIYKRNTRQTDVTT